MASRKLADSMEQALLDLVNKDNGIAMTLDGVGFSVPVAIEPTEDDPRNTEVVLSSKDTDLVRGETKCQYTRVEAVIGLTNTETTEKPTVVKVEFNHQNGTASIAKTYLTDTYIPGLHTPIETANYTLSDLVDIDPNDTESEDGYFQWKTTVTMVDHLVLVGTATVLLSSKYVPLRDIVKTTELSGFTYP